MTLIREFNLTAVCDVPCQNGGSCTAPNMCTCPSKFEGTLCQIGKFFEYLTFSTFCCIYKEDKTTFLSLEIMTSYLLLTSQLHNEQNTFVYLRTSNLKLANKSFVSLQAVNSTIALMIICLIVLSFSRHRRSLSSRILNVDVKYMNLSDALLWRTLIFYKWRIMRN